MNPNENRAWLALHCLRVLARSETWLTKKIAQGLLQWELGFGSHSEVEWLPQESDKKPTTQPG